MLTLRESMPPSGSTGKASGTQLLSFGGHVGWVQRQQIDFQSFQSFRANAANVPQIFNCLKWAVLAAIFHNSLGKRLADLWNCNDFTPVGGVYVDLEIDGLFIGMVDFDEPAAQAAMRRPVHCERDKAEQTTRGDQCLIDAAQQPMVGLRKWIGRHSVKARRTVLSQ
jgi:hypothetical protein